MDFFVVGVILITSAIQSVFGVGVLLFGTPLLIMSGYSFTSTLSVLLPLSLTINVLQIVKEREFINFDFFRRLLLFSVPSIVISLIFVVEVDLDFSILIGLFLVIISLKFFSERLWNIVIFFFSYERTYFVITGIVHGVSNLGGGLLTSKVFSMNATRQEKRATISACYFTFAMFQVITLILLGEFQWFRIEYLLLGITIYFVVEYLVSAKIPSKNYDYFFAVFLFFSGISLINKGVL